MHEMERQKQTTQTDVFLILTRSGRFFPWCTQKESQLFGFRICTLIYRYQSTAFNRKKKKKTKPLFIESHVTWGCHRNNGNQTRVSTRHQGPKVHKLNPLYLVSPPIRDSGGTLHAREQGNTSVYTTQT